jgi:hypothetical protein
MLRFLPIRLVCFVVPSLAQSLKITSKPAGAKIELVLRIAGRFEPCSLVPTEHTQRTERVPPTRLAHRLAERERQRLVVRAIEEPSTVGLLPALDDMQGLADARVGLETCVPEVVECTENVVVVTGRERELQERRIRDLAGRARAAN